MPPYRKTPLASYFLLLVLIALFGMWLKNMDIESNWHQAGLINFSLGFVLLLAYISSKLFEAIKLPLISGYIIAGIMAGPYICNFLTTDMVSRLRLVDDLALSFIALTAGGELRLQALQKQGRLIVFNIILQTAAIFLFVFLFILLTGRLFSFTSNLTSYQLIVIALLLGIICIARSPSSAIAIISETRASGPFSDTVLGVTVVMDVLIIVLFTLAITVSKMIISGCLVMDSDVFKALSLELLTSFAIGAMIGICLVYYIKRINTDLPLFLLFIAFSVSKTSLWISHYMDVHFALSLHLEPLLICMTAGFFVQNFSSTGKPFMESLDQFALPIYVLFFSLAGAALNLDSLTQCWHLALCLVIIRAIGIFSGAYISGILVHNPPVHNKFAGLAYLTQAGVAIGLAKITLRKFPEIGAYLLTIVLAIITINQLIGPITFKVALGRVNEIDGRR